VVVVVLSLARRHEASCYLLEPCARLPYVRQCHGRYCHIYQLSDRTHRAGRLHVRVLTGRSSLYELLYSLTEEAIRGLVHSVRHDQVHDLREEFAEGMKTDLNAKLKSFGVFIQNVKVTNVDLPPALSHILEETTAFKTRMEEQEKTQENQMRVLLNQETQRLTAL
jgi:hypothetical protein